jgi:hypothetical protein
MPSLTDIKLRISDTNLSKFYQRVNKQEGIEKKRLRLPPALLEDTITVANHGLGSMANAPSLMSLPTMLPLALFKMTFTLQFVLASDTDGTVQL